MIDTPRFLNNGHCVVDLRMAKQISQSRLLHLGDGYGHETEKRYTAWKSDRSGKWFITMEYTEHIACFFTKRQKAHGHTLVGVYDTENALLKSMRDFEIPAPVEIMEQV